MDIVSLSLLFAPGYAAAGRNHRGFSQVFYTPFYSSITVAPAAALMHFLTGHLPGYPFLVFLSLLCVYFVPKGARNHSSPSIALRIVWTMIGLWSIQTLFSALDFDYWIDLPLLGTIGQNSLPPAHPYFPDSRLSGNFGFVYWVALLKGSLRWEALDTMQCWKTYLLLLSGPLAFWTLTTLTSSPIRRSMGSLLLMVGTYSGNWCGLVDFQFHHYLHSGCLLVWGTGLVARSRNACSASWVIAIQSFFFDLNGLALLFLFALRFGLGRKFLAAALLLMPLMALVPNTFGLLLVNRSQASAIGHSRQSIVLSVPKSELGTLVLPPSPNWRLSRFWRVLIPSEAKDVSVTRPTEAYFWSWEALRAGSPLTVLLIAFLPFLGKKAAGYMGVSFVFFLTPYVVGFGPVFDQDSFRWVALAGSFAAFSWIVISIPDKFWALLTTFILLPSLPSWLCNTRDLGGVREWTENPSLWATSKSHPHSLSLSDLEAARRLRSLQITGDGLATNLYLGEPFEPSPMLGPAILASTANLSLRGYADEISGVGMPPNTRSSMLVRFLLSPKQAVKTLDEIKADWLLIRHKRMSPTSLSELDSMAELTKLATFTDSEGETSSIYRVNSR